MSYFAHFPLNIFMIVQFYLFIHLNYHGFYLFQLISYVWEIFIFFKLKFCQICIYLSTFSWVENTGFPSFHWVLSSWILFHQIIQLFLCLKYRMSFFLRWLLWHIVGKSLFQKMFWLSKRGILFCYFYILIYCRILIFLTLCCFTYFFNKVHKSFAQSIILFHNSRVIDHFLNILKAYLIFNFLVLDKFGLNGQ